KLILYTTADHKRLRITLTAADNTPLFDRVMACGPAAPVIEEIAIGQRVATELVLVVVDEGGKVLISYTERPVEDQPTPAAATAPELPEDVESVEDLYLIGLHLEQY